VEPIHSAEPNRTDPILTIVMASHHSKSWIVALSSLAFPHVHVHFIWPLHANQIDASEYEPILPDIARYLRHFPEESPPHF
jgi:hypothetical protein